ncbi:hypothetical protein UPYG_G00205310 [Umbra pygmaea]|uniref:DUF4806 domain-containing protein n=1 Tax=Umbra pygmaea TaxID=75934 RepID=A0ABD0WJ04_UMBPY
MGSSEFTTLNWGQELEARPDCHQGATYTELTTSRWSPDTEVEARLPTAWQDEGQEFLERSRSRPLNTQVIQPNCTAVERIILEQLGELHLKVDHLTAMVQSLSANRTQDHHSLSNDHDQILPISTLEDLNVLDERLPRDIDFKKSVTAKLSITGGNSVKKTVWRVCRKVFSPQLATQLNWCGRGQKTGIRTRPVKEIILSAVLGNGALSSVTEAETEMAIQNWLRLSQDRVRGRRRQRTEEDA